MAFLPHGISGLERRTARIRLVVSCPHAIPNQTSPTVPEILAGTARRPSGVESPPQDHRRSGRQPHRRLRFSCARPPPTDRTRSAGTCWRAAVKRLLPAAYLPSSPTTDHLPKLQPSTISGLGEVSGDQPRDARQTSSSIRGSCCQRESSSTYCKLSRQTGPATVTEVPCAG